MSEREHTSAAPQKRAADSASGRSPLFAEGAGRGPLLQRLLSRLVALGLQHELPLTYAQLVFSRSRVVGLLLFLATATSPRGCLGGFLAVLSASLTARLLTLDGEARREGTFGYNALLLGLGVGHSFAGPSALLVLALIIAPASAALTAALRTSLAARALPILSWPFLFLYMLVLCAVPVSGGLLVPLPPEAGAFSEALTGLLPGPVTTLLRGLGALFFTPEPLAGGLLLLALLWHSRIAALLATVGIATAAMLGANLSLPEGSLVALLGYNTAFTAMALGGVWFVPSPSSFLLSLFGVALCLLFVAGAQAPLARLGLPLMVLPFNLVVTVLLLALRQRSADRAPKSVDFLPGTPEENLSYFRTRLLRFRWLYALRLSLPFRGAWLCTQAVDGSFTHKGRWRHAYDFEVRGEGGLLFHGDGSLPEHYHAYRLPVLATAGGTVVKVVNHVPDNPIGTMNLAENWGNLVLLYHGPGLYSLVAHLHKGSVRVVEGQVVRQGDLLGLCGNSGRSPQPHLHFHLQGSDRLGEGTLPCRFNDVVVSPRSRPIGPGKSADSISRAEPLQHHTIHTAISPAQGDELRNLDASADAAAFLLMHPGAEWRFLNDGGEPQAPKNPAQIEHIVSEVDLYGRRLLRSRERSAVLYFELGDLFFHIFDVVGDAGSVLHLLRAALPRVPFEATEALRWRDHLPARPLRTVPQRLLADFLSPFLRHDGIEVELRLVREGQTMIVSGESLRRDRGVPLLRTRVVLGIDGAPRRVEVTLRGRTTTAERVLPEAPQG